MVQSFCGFITRVVREAEWCSVYSKVFNYGTKPFCKMLTALFLYPWITHGLASIKHHPV